MTWYMVGVGLMYLFLVWSATADGQVGIGKIVMSAVLSLFWPLIVPWFIFAALEDYRRHRRGGF